MQTSNSYQDNNQPARAVILTALRVEYLAIRAYLTNPQEDMHHRGTIYERGGFLSGGQAWEIGIVEIGPGNRNAASEAERAINHFDPQVALFVGVAGGIKDVGLGDVVAATKVYGYESGKAGENFQTRPEVGNSAYRLVQRARVEARKSDWQRQLSESQADRPPEVFVGPIAAGEKVVASTQSAVWQFLRSHYSDALAVEMEGHGFLHAIQANPGVDALVIRGISDLIEGKSEADAQGFQEIAARHASAFAFEILAKLKGSQVQKPDDMKREPTTSPLPPDTETEHTERPTVFISYSRKDEKEKDALLTHLSVLQKADLVEVWSDDRIGAGANWRQEIEQAMSQARVAILLVTANFLTTDFIVKEQIPALLQQHQNRGLTIFPVIAKPCAWKAVQWLADMSVRPGHEKPVWRGGGIHADEELANIANEVADIIARAGPPAPNQIPGEENIDTVDLTITAPDGQQFEADVPANMSVEELLRAFLASWRPPDGQGSQHYVLCKDGPTGPRLDLAESLAEAGLGQEANLFLVGKSLTPDSPVSLTVEDKEGQQFTTAVVLGTPIRRVAEAFLHNRPDRGAMRAELVTAGGGPEKERPLNLDASLFDEGINHEATLRIYRAQESSQESRL